MPMVAGKKLAKMKYFFDTEFIEGFHKPLFGKRRHFIDLISIGIIAEDGRTYYAISNEFNPKDADDWVKKNVIGKLEQRATSIYDSPRLRQNCLLYKSNKQIAEDIKAFVYNHPAFVYNEHYKELIVVQKSWLDTGTPEFYAYYADYDWVVFCSLFGRMIDLPKYFPMYCRDLKQMLDDFTMSNMKAGYGLWNEYKRSASEPDLREHSFDECLERIKLSGNYPQQKNEHNALDDAKWNFELYKFLQELTK